MKILQFADEFIPIFGGSETRIFNLSLDRINQHYLYVSFLNTFTSLKAKENFDNLRVHRVKLFYDFKSKNKTIKYILNHHFLINFYSTKLVNFVKEKNFDIIQGHDPMIFAKAGMKYARKYKIPFIYETHRFGSDDPIIRNNQYIPKLLHSLIFKPIILNERKIVKYANAIIVQTKGIKQRMRNFYKINPTKIKIIPMGVDLNKFDPIKWNQKGKEFRKKNHWEGKIILFYNGYLEHLTGIKSFLNVIIKLPIEIKKKILMIILGKGPLQNFIKNLSIKYKDLIEFHNYIHYDIMPLYYSACDVVISPLLSISFVKDNIPTKLLEGMAMEKIILGSDVPGIKGIITHNKNGIIFKSESKVDLIKKIYYIVENFENLNDLRKQARKLMIEKYSWIKMRFLLQKVYDYVTSCVN